MAEQPVKITPVPIPDGFLTEVDGETTLTQIQVGEETVSIDVFMSMLEGGMKLREIVISRDEKRAKTKYEPVGYFASYKLNVEPMQLLLDLVPDGPQRVEARKTVGRVIVKRFREIEEFLSRCIKSSQQKDGIQPYWRKDQKPVF